MFGSVVWAWRGIWLIPSPAVGSWETKLLAQALLKALKAEVGWQACAAGPSNFVRLPISALQGHRLGHPKSMGCKSTPTGAHVFSQTENLASHNLHWAQYGHPGILHEQADCFDVKRLRRPPCLALRARCCHGLRGWPAGRWTLLSTTLTDIPCRKAQITAHLNLLGQDLGWQAACADPPVACWSGGLGPHTRAMSRGYQMAP